MKTVILGISSLFFAASTFAQDSNQLDPIEVKTLKNSNKISTKKIPLTEMSGDTANLLKMTPGVTLQGAGGMSSLPMIHGMGSDRVNIKIDQAQITSSCPNHMNPSFSYIDPAKVGTIETMAGITTVSDGGDSIGGSIVVKTKTPQFAKDDEALKKLNLTSSFKSNNENMGASLNMSVANKNTSVSYSGFDESAHNYRTGNGDRLKGTLYNQNNQSLTIGRKLDDGVLSLKLGRAVVPYQGFINQYMDMTDNVANSLNLRYEGNIGRAFVESSVFHQHTNHLMDILSSERSGQMPMYTRADETGYNVKATIDLNSNHSLKVGTDFVRYRLDDWWPAVDGMTMMMGPGTYQSINNGKRDRIGAFVETNSVWTNNITSNLGLRTDIVSMNTGSVHGYNDTDNLPADAAAFNNSSRIHHDRNYDLTFITDFKANRFTDLEFGLARKTRSPNLYERYAWAGSVTNPDGSAASMDMRMINWFGDGNGYVGNLNLKPEVANTISTSITLHDESYKEWKVKLTPYYTSVENYIDTDFVAKSSMDGVNFLKFANHDAIIFGADLSIEAMLLRSSTLGEFTFRATGNYTRGYRRDGMTNLYNLKPLNGTFMMVHGIGKWTSNLSLQVVKSKDQVNSLRLEEKTAGYALLDLGTSYQITKLIKLDLGISNLLDHNYSLPLGGIDLVNHTAADHRTVLGMGRSINTAVSIDFF